MIMTMSTKFGINIKQPDANYEIAIKDTTYKIKNEKFQYEPF